jgi:hypothetical protein
MLSKIRFLTLSPAFWALVFVILGVDIRGFKHSNLFENSEYPQKCVLQANFPGGGTPWP